MVPSGGPQTGAASSVKNLHHPGLLSEMMPSAGSPGELRPRESSERWNHHEDNCAERAQGGDRFLR